MEGLITAVVVLSLIALIGLICFILEYRTHIAVEANSEETINSQAAEIKWLTSQIIQLRDEVAWADIVLHAREQTIEDQEDEITRLNGLVESWINAWAKASGHNVVWADTHDELDKRIMEWAQVLGTNQVKGD